MHRLVLIILSAFSLVASPAAAERPRSAMWVVSQLSGDARVVHSGLQPASLKANAQLAPGDTVLTGQTGRATLVRGADYIVIAPRSELRLPTAPQPNGFTRVIQNLGTMLFKVQHTGVPHFAVDTPMLAAVVKGTTFTVVVDQDRSAVQVTEGTVQVTALDGGMSRYVEGGRTVFVNHADPKTLINADGGTPATGTTSSNAVKINGSKTPSVASVAAMTGGLVRPVAASPVPASPTASPVAVAAVAAPLTSIATRGTAASPPASSAPVVTPTTPAPPVTLPVTPAPPVVALPTIPELPVTPPAIADPVVDIVDVTLPTITEPVLDIVDATLPAVTEPVLDIVDTTIPAVTEPVVDIVDTTITTVTEPVVDIVDTTIPAVTDPIVDIVDTTITTVTEPVTGILDLSNSGPSDNSGPGSLNSGSGSLLSGLSGPGHL